MESLLVATNAVIPFMCYLLLGGITNKMGLADDKMFNRMNKMCFRMFYPFMSFYNVYKASKEAIPSVKLLVILVGGILFFEGILLIIVPIFIHENPKKGVVMQAIVRSNFVLLGLAMAQSVYGDNATSMAAMIITFISLTYNITAVIILELYSDRPKTGIKSLLMGIIKNPMLDGCFFGIIFFIFQWKLPTCLITPISAISSMTTPFALFILGGTLHFSSIGKNLKYLVPILAGKLVILPAIMTAFAYAVGLRGVELFFMIIVFATPVATASYPMAVNMGGDGELAGQSVVISTVLSVVTLFLWIYFMKLTGLII